MNNQKTLPPYWEPVDSKYPPYFQRVTKSNRFMSNEKTLGQVAYEAHTKLLSWDEVSESLRRPWERIASAVAEEIIQICIPGGDICDPQQIADAIRERMAK